MNPDKSADIVFGNAKVKGTGNAKVNRIESLDIEDSEFGKMVRTFEQLKFIQQLKSRLKKTFLNLRCLYSNKHVLSRKLCIVLSDFEKNRT